MLRYIELTVCNIIFVTFDISWSNGRMKRFTTNDLIALTFSHHYHGCIYFNTVNIRCTVGMYFLATRTIANDLISRDHII